VEAVTAGHPGGDGSISPARDAAAASRVYPDD